MLQENQEEIQELAERFKFHFEVEPKDERVLYLKFEDGRFYELLHPGALAVARLFSTTSDKVMADCVEYFLNNCITPKADGKTKRLDPDNMDIDEMLDLWMPLAWRYLRHSSKIALRDINNHPARNS